MKRAFCSFCIVCSFCPIDIPFDTSREPSNSNSSRVSAAAHCDRRWDTCIFHRARSAAPAAASAHESIKRAGRRATERIGRPVQGVLTSEPRAGTALTQP